jgi:hypothetical protein
MDHDRNIQKMETNLMTYHEYIKYTNKIMLLKKEEVQKWKEINAERVSRGKEKIAEKRMKGMLRIQEEENKEEE